MMRDRPDAATLLALAREAPPREEALIRRAAAIAAREPEGDDAFAACRAALVARYGAGEDAALMRHLAAEIAAGAFDDLGTERDGMRRLLWAITRAKLAESNPDYLAAAEAG